jgi:hypothetical protein
MTAQPCAECGAPAARRLCDECLEAFARDWERRHGLPPGGRDPAEVDHELDCRRGAALLLHGRLTGNRADEHAGMTVVLAECHARPGWTPAAAIVPPLLNLATLVVDGYLAGALVTAWRAQFVEALRGAGAIAAAEAQVADDAELIRDCRATEAATVVMCGRLTGDQDLEAEGWRLVEALAAEHNATAAGLLLGAVLGLIGDHVHGTARERLVDALAHELMLYAGPAPDTAEGLT